MNNSNNCSTYKNELMMNNIKINWIVLCMEVISMSIVGSNEIGHLGMIEGILDMNLIIDFLNFTITLVIQMVKIRSEPTQLYYLEHNSFRLLINEIMYIKLHLNT